LVVVSGDSDYTPLISKLREYNKYVIVIGYKENVSDLLKGYCDELIYYSKLVADDDTAEDIDTSIAYNLLNRAVNYLDNQGIETCSSQVKSYMKQLDSSFNETNYGFSKFKIFLQQALKDKIVTLIKKENSGDYIIRNNDNNDQPANGGRKTENLQIPIHEKILAIIRKNKAQFLGVHLQQIVLKTIYDVLSTTRYPLTSSELVDNYVDKLKNPYIENGKLSKTKINQVWQIIYRTRCCKLIKDDDDSPTKQFLADDISDYNTLRDKHDYYIIFLSLKNEIDMNAKSWAVFLHGRTNQSEKMKILIERAKEFISSQAKNDNSD
jgi:hypothetical protein